MKPKPGQTCKYCNVLLTRDNAHLHSGGRRHYFKIAGWCKACHDKVVLGGLCVRPGCINPRVWNRRICVAHTYEQSNEAKKKRKQEPTKPGSDGCNPHCSAWKDCTINRLWAGFEPVPCEALLDDEIGMTYETGELSLFVVPVMNDWLVKC